MLRAFVIRSLCFLFLSLATFVPVFSQNQPENFPSSLNGIWIAEDYLESFEKTKSVHASKTAFDPNFPAGLRINSSSLIDGKMIVGSESLHNHLFQPEVAGFLVVGSDTIYEQGFFLLNPFADSNGLFKTDDVEFFSYSGQSFLKFDLDGNDTILVLFRYPVGDETALEIKYKRVARGFSTNYPNPTPLRYYLRNKVLAGDYELYDKNGVVLSKKIKVGNDGLIFGFRPLDGKYLDLSSDIYCGNTDDRDEAILSSRSLNGFVDIDRVFVIEQKRKGFSLLSRDWVGENESEELVVGDIQYLFIRR